MTQTHTIKYPITTLEDERSDREIVIPYRPYYSAEKWLEYRFSEWNTWKAWFAILLVVGFFTLKGPDQISTFVNFLLSTGSGATPDGGLTAQLGNAMHGASAVGTGAAAGAGLASGVGTAMSFSSVALLQWMGVAGLICGGLIAWSQSRQPTHLALSEKGIAWEWRRWPFNHGKLIPWEDVRYIHVSKISDNALNHDVSLVIDTDQQEAAMQFKLAGIATSEEKETFLNGLNSWAPNVRRDPAIMDLFTPPPEHSYTELWMQALSAPPKRERLAPLPPATPLRGGEFVIVNQIGVGGQGTAYLSTAENGHEVVLKEFILPVYVELNVRRQALERMQNEVEMLKRLDSDRIVKLNDFFVEDHRGYLVLERIDGDSLRTIVSRDGKLSEAQVVSLANQMCDILTYLHSLSPPVVHRDFTPDNLILNTEGFLKLVDFNVAQQKEATATGTVVGKHAYIPPEQFRGKPTTQSDIYAMGATLFYLLFAEDPEPISTSRPKETDASISNGLDHLIATATALDPKYRYATIEELQKDLTEML